MNTIIKAILLAVFSFNIGFVFGLWWKSLFENEK